MLTGAAVFSLPGYRPLSRFTLNLIGRWSEPCQWKAEARRLGTGLDQIAFILIAFVASFASAIFGFGSALLVLALGSQVLPVKETIALATVLFTASTVTKSFLFRNYIDWKMVGVMSFACLPFAYLGAQLLAVAPAEFVKPALGAMILIYVGLTLAKRLPSIHIGVRGLFVGSVLYGFVSGFLGSGNVIKVVLFREMKITKEAFVGAMAATAVLSNIVKLSSYAQSGLLKADMAWTAFALILVAVVVALAGRFFLTKLSAEVFQTGVQVLLGIAAIALLV